jgi:hypothetical protein
VVSGNCDFRTPGCVAKDNVASGLVVHFEARLPKRGYYFT